MNAKDLELKISGLEKAIKEHDDASVTFQNDLKLTQKQLDDYNKPELTSSQFDDIYEAIERGVSNYDFSDIDNFDKEFGIDYDGRVTLEQFDINNSQQLVEAIIEEVSKLFTEVEAPEDNE